MRADRLGIAACASALLAAGAVSCAGADDSTARPAISISAPWSLPAGLGVPGGVAAGRDGTLAVISGSEIGASGVGRPVSLAVRRPGGRWVLARRITGSAYEPTAARAVVDPRGGITVAWVRTRCRLGTPPVCGAKSFLQVRSASPAGRWGPIETLGPAGYEQTFAIAAEAHGGASVAWRDGRGVRVARRGDGERRRPAATVATNRPQDDGAIALATSADGRAYVAYATTPDGAAQQDPPQPFVAVAARGRDGRWGTPQQVSGRPAARPAITVAGDGAVVVAWRESSFDSDDFPRYGGVGAAIGTADATFGAPQHVAPGVRTTAVLLASARSGETVLGWSALADPPGPLDYGVRKPRATSFGATRRARGTRAQLELGVGTLAMLDDGTTLFVGLSDGPGIGVAVRPPGGAFARPRVVVPRGSAANLAAAGARATLVYRDDVARRPRVLTLTGRSGAG